MNEDQLELKACCRTCGTNLLADCGKCLFQSTENASEAVSTDILKLLSLLKFNIHKEDGLPQQICECCLETFTAIEEFRQKCQRMQTILMEIQENEKKTDEPDDSPGDLVSSHQFETIEEINYSSAEAICEDPLSVEQENLQIEDDLFENDCDENSWQIEYVAPKRQKPKPANLAENQRRKKYTDDQLLECKFCNGKFALIVAHYRECPKRNVEICHYCDMDIPTKDELKAHINEKHSDKLPACSICAVTFPTFKERLLHRMKIHTPFRCKFCDYTTASRNGIKFHIDAFHAEKLNKSCPICQKVCATQKRYDYHMKTHDPSSKNFACRYCNKRFLCSHHRDNHERGIHTGEKLFVCEQCGKAFNQMSEMIAHRKYIHLKEPRKYSYKTAMSLKQKTSIKCPHTECGKILHSKYSFEKHIALLHRKNELGERIYPFNCTICYRGFNGANALAFHLKLHEPDRPHKCDICNSAYKRRRHLESHIKTIHRKEENFVCPHCDKKFSEKYSLNGHMVKHSSEKPHKCTDCTASFKTGRQLNIHRRIHTGEKPYKCLLCGKLFITNSVLADHLYYKHTDEEKQLLEDQIMSSFSENTNDFLLGNEIIQQLEVEVVPEEVEISIS